MIKKWFIGLFLVFSCLSVSFAQTVKKTNAVSWEYLQVSDISGNCDSQSGNCREYYYFNSGLRRKGPISLEWLNNAGWELADVVAKEGSFDGLLFKRIFDKTRTEKEMRWLTAELDNEARKREAERSGAVLLDLDEVEAGQNLAAFNKNEESRLRTALEELKNLPLKIISVSSKSLSVERSRVGAEIVLDGTSIFLKDGNKYRSSEVEKYFNETVNQIVEKAGLFIQYKSFPYKFEGAARTISRGGFRPEIGNFSLKNEGVTLKISVIVNYRNEQIVVAQNSIVGGWKNKTK